MTPILICIVSVLCMFGGALLGMWLRNRLPDHHLRDDSKDTVKVGAAMVTSLSALVLGLLVSSAKNAYDVMGTEITQSAAKIVLLDRLFVNYGPETKTVRKLLHDSILETVSTVWPDDDALSPQLAAFDRANYMESVQLKFLDLVPSTASQRLIMSQAESIILDLRQTRWLLVEQAHGELPTIFLVVLIFWLSIMHLSFGLFAPCNSTSLSVLFLSSVSVSCALYLIIELSHPMHGLVKLSVAPIRNAIEHLEE